MIILGFCDIHWSLPPPSASLLNLILQTQFSSILLLINYLSIPQKMNLSSFRHWSSLSRLLSSSYSLRLSSSQLIHSSLTVSFSTSSSSPSWLTGSWLTLLPFPFTYILVSLFIIKLVLLHNRAAAWNQTPDVPDNVEIHGVDYDSDAAFADKSYVRLHKNTNVLFIIAKLLLTIF